MSKKCANCGYDMPDEASFCMHCCTRSFIPKEVKTAPKSNNKKFFIFLCSVIVILAAAAIVVLLNGSNNTPPTPSADIVATDTTPTTEPTDTPATDAVTDSTSSTTTSTTTVTTSTTQSTTDTTTDVTENSTTRPTTKAGTKRTTTSPSGSFACASYGNGVRITRYSGNESSITIPDKIDGKAVLSVGAKAFCNNRYIKSITFESGRQRGGINISPAAFCNLPALRSIRLPADIECDNFADCISGCTALQSIQISSGGGNGAYLSEQGVVYKRLGNGTTSLVYYPPGRSSSYYSIPYKVSRIERNAFSKNKHLRTIRFSKREKLEASWKSIFSTASLPRLDTIQIYVGTDVDLEGIQYFDGEIVYYD